MIKPIHPFPARMAPEILSNKLATLGTVGTLWDPMCGSGTSLRIGALRGIRAFGSDTDPLAVKMANVGTRNYELGHLRGAIDAMRERVMRTVATGPVFTSCDETDAFKEFWFASPQREALEHIAACISDVIDLEIREFFEIALSRIIITKLRGASLAWDVSHSRPHRKRTENDFDVELEFFLSCEKLAGACLEAGEYASVDICRADARTSAPPSKVDLVVTSPPYLNAIDYMRGHKLSLVWMGWTIPQLRELRAQAIGAERRLESFEDSASLAQVEAAAVLAPESPSRLGLIIRRYIEDCSALMTNISNHMAAAAQLILVVADSNVRGYKVRSDALFCGLAAKNGLRLVDTSEREIPSNKRYLPASSSTGIGNRMKNEWVLHFAAS